MLGNYTPGIYAEGIKFCLSIFLSISMIVSLFILRYNKVLAKVSPVVNISVNTDQGSAVAQWLELTRDQRAVSLSLTGITALSFLSKTHLS